MCLLVIPTVESLLAAPTVLLLLPPVQAPAPPEDPAEDEGAEGPRVGQVALGVAVADLAHGGAADAGVPSEGHGAPAAGAAALQAEAVRHSALALRVHHARERQ